MRPGIPLPALGSQPPRTRSTRRHHTIKRVIPPQGVLARPAAPLSESRPTSLAWQLVVRSEHEAAPAHLVKDRVIVFPQEGAKIRHRRPDGRGQQLSELLRR
jgi:hypothetical protein